MSDIPAHRYYYLTNFQRALDWIGQRCADLLIDDERDFIALFPTLPHAARALLVRLVMRRGALFRISKLVYPEIGCARTAAGALPAHWVEHDPVMGLDEAATLLVKPELVRTFGLSAPLKAARKPEQLQALRADPAHAAPRPFSQWRPAADDDLALRLQVRPLCDRLRLIFFGNLNQDWSEFVLADLGTFRYEQVDFSADARGFRARGDIEQYLCLHALKERYYGGEPAADILADLAGTLPASLDNPWIESRRQRLLFQLGQAFEKERDWPRAYTLYSDCRYPGARARALRVLEKDQRFEQALVLWQHAQAAPESDTERQQLQRIGARLARRLGQPPLARLRPAAAERLELVLPPATDMRVEATVMRHLWRAEAPVFYVENTLANALFGLLCWRAVFAAVPGAFFHPFHRGPADLYSADFQQRRGTQFAQCLALLDGDGYRQAMLATFDDKAGVQSPFVAWDHVAREVIELALDCIPAAHLKLWCLRILQDLRENRTGFPDLIQFWPQQKTYRMIEVKGPGDRLQDNQVRWIDYCARHAMPVSVCYLQWQQAAA